MVPVSRKIKFGVGRFDRDLAMLVQVCHISSDLRSSFNSTRKSEEWTN